MVREVITLGVGQAGVRMTNKFFESIADEHEIAPDGKLQDGLKSSNKSSQAELEGVNTFFCESVSGRYIPRSIFVDLDPAPIDEVRASPYGAVYRPSNLINGRSGTGSNYAKGKYGEGSVLTEIVVDTMRREIEQCDSFSGFQIVHSTCGGTGSGMTVGLLREMRQIWPDRTVSSFTLFSSPSGGASVVEPYNTVLSTNELIRSCHFCYLIDNDSLFKNCAVSLGIAQPTLSDMNKVVATAMSDVTASYRFPGIANQHMNKCGVNMVPFSRLHFFCLSSAPIMSEKKLETSACQNSVESLSQLMFHQSSYLFSVDPRYGRILASTATFRGKIASSEVGDQMLNIQNRYSSYFVEWIPSSVKSVMVNVPPKGKTMSATLASNTSAVKESIKSANKKLTTMYRQKKYVHWFTDEGMDEMEFVEAESNVNDLVSEYQQYENASADDYADDDDDDDDDY